MDVYIIMKQSNGNPGLGRPVAAVLQDTGCEAPFKAYQHAIAHTPAQLGIQKAVKEVDALSAEARKKLGITFNRINSLRREANAGLSVAPGDKLVAFIAGGEVAGVYTKVSAMDKPGAFIELPVYATSEAYFKAAGYDSAQREIDGLSRETKEVFGLTKPEERAPVESAAARLSHMKLR